MAEENNFKPYIPAEQTVPELTFASLAVGILLAAILCAANVYVGLMARMTVGASIPAAVISMAILRGIFKRGSILENNMVQTMASAGESIAAGIIFTIPAIVLTGAWTEFKFFPTLLVGILGGMLGILFMIPLRRALIIEEKELIYPCGVACSEILKTGQEGGTGVKYIFGAVGIGIVYALLMEFKILAAKITGAFHVKQVVFAAGGHLSLALVSVGYIIGLNVSVLVFMGGALAWLVGVPVYMALTDASAGSFESMDAAYKAAENVWASKIRYMGAGAMVIGGLWSIWCMRGSIVSSLHELGRSIKKRGRTEKKRTERNLPMTVIIPVLGVVITGIFFLYLSVTGDLLTTVVATVAMLVTAFLFVAVSSYIVGLVGSSNNPVSGMTIFTLFIAILLLLAFGIKGGAGDASRAHRRGRGVLGRVCGRGHEPGPENRLPPRRHSQEPADRADYRSGRGVLCHYPYSHNPP